MDELLGLLQGSMTHQLFTSAFRSSLVWLTILSWTANLQKLVYFGITTPFKNFHFSRLIAMAELSLSGIPASEAIFQLLWCFSDLLLEFRQHIPYSLVNYFFSNMAVYHCIKTCWQSPRASNLLGGLLKSTGPHIRLLRYQSASVSCRSVDIYENIMNDFPNSQNLF